MARFLERASTAREEAERLASTLDAQTRALDDFSTTLPVRVSEAESVLRGVADRLYASEQLAREQAVHLSEKLSQQVDGLQGFMDRFTGRLTDIHTGLDLRQNDLNNLSDRIGTTTTGFLSAWEKSVSDLSDRTGNSLLRFTVVNDETRRNAESVAAHLNETTGKYEDVVVRMRALSSDSSVQMKGMTEEITRHLAQFESLSKASNKAGEEVQQRAAQALQNLQHVLERVLAARDATQTVGQTLVKDINDAMTQNEKMIQRLNETAQLGARAIGGATEAMGRQQTELVGKARAGETSLLESAQRIQQQAEITGKGLREQTTGLMNLLSETQSQLISTDQKLQSFAAQAVAPVQKAVTQLDSASEQGLRTLSIFGEGLTTQVARLQDFHSRIGGMSEEMGKTTAESARVFENLSERFAVVRASQDDMARQTLAQFTDLSERLQREVVGLDNQASQAAEALQQAAIKIGEQSYQMLQNAQGSGVQIKDVATALQAEVVQIQSLLRSQTDSISSDLARAEQRFTTLGETIREKADAAYALIDRTAAHYGEVAQQVEQKVDGAHQKVESLHAALARQADQIGSDAVKIEYHAGEITTSSARALQDLSALDDKMTDMHRSAVTHHQEVLGKLDQSASAFERRASDMTEAALTASSAVAKAGAAFGEQTGMLVDGGHQIDAVLRQLTLATTSLNDQATAIRTSMEQQNSRLISQLTDSVVQMDLSGNKLQQIVIGATQGVDHASARFEHMTDHASQRLGATTDDLVAMAARAETVLAALGADVTQQAASLAIVGDQIGEQQRLLADANERQRAQMVELFDKLGAAHAQASEIAERSISYVSNSLQEISRQIGQVGDQAQTAVGTVKMASVSFSDQSVLLLQNAQAAEQQARNVLLVTSSLQEQAKHLRESLQHESDRAGECLGALLGRLTQGGTEVRELGSSTGAVIISLQQALGEQSKELGSSMQDISERQRSLTSALDQQRETINGLLNRLTLAQDEASTSADRAATRLADGAQQIVRHVETLDARAQSALSSVQTASAGFAYEAEAIEKQARQAEAQARTILSSATGMHEQISGLRSSMREEGEMTNAVLGSLLDKVTMGAAEIRDLGASTEMSLTTLGSNVENQSTNLTASMQQISQRQQTLATALETQSATITALLLRLTESQSATAASADRATTSLTEGSQNILRQVESIDTRSHMALSAVHSAAEAFAKEAAAIDTEAKHAEQQAQAMLASASGLHGQIYDLRTSMQYDGERATEALNNLLNRITSGNGELRDMSTVTEETLVSLQRGLSDKAIEIGGTMVQISDRQRGLTAALEQQRDVINGLLSHYASAQNETAVLAERTAERLNDGVQKITNSIDMIGAQASSTLASVQASVSGFTEQAELLRHESEQAQAQVRGVLSVTAGMQDQAKHLREAMQVETAHVVEQMSAIIAQLDLTGRQLKSESGSVMQALDLTAQRFRGDDGSGYRVHASAD